MSVIGDFLLKILPLEERRDVMHFTLWILFLLSFAGSHGFLPIHPGFALANRAEETNQKVDRIEVRLLEKELFETRLNQCGVSTDRSRAFYREKLQGLLREYHRITGTTYNLATCEELK